MSAKQLRIVDVDMNGFCGREHHPRLADVGLVVAAIEMKTIYFDADGSEYELTAELLRTGIHGVVTGAELLAMVAGKPAAGEAAGEGLLAFYTCVTEDGRVLDLVEFEVAEVVHV